MKTPKFFYQKSIIPLFLIPFSVLFYLATIIRNLLIKPHFLKGKFVICIGNATAGGGGKTPSAILIAKALKRMGFSVCFLSRGYGRKTKGFSIASQLEGAMHTGDEVQLLLRVAPVYLFSSYSEVFLNQSLIKESVIIMDDGFQNPSIIKNFSVLVVDGKLRFGNGFLLPAGPLRESPISAISRADAIFNIKGKALGLQNEYQIGTSFEMGEISRDANYLAFCGLASNQKFFLSLEELGLKVVKKLEFEDHHNYSNKDVEGILRLASEQGLTPITTEKDVVKIPLNQRHLFCVLKIELTLEDDTLLRYMGEKIQKMQDLS